MKILRAGILVVFFINMLLLASTTEVLKGFLDSVVIAWLFIFAWPATYLVFIATLVLVVQGIRNFIATREMSTVLWLFFDILFTVSSFALFELYYSKINAP